MMAFCLSIVILSTYGLALAGDWHNGTSLHCGDCHVEHGIAGGDPIPGGPFSTMLKKSTINSLCLTCHDGSDATAPDVLTPVTMYNGTTSLESGGGHFQMPGTVSPYGHTLDVAVETPLNSSRQMTTLSCANCHDYHGNSNYRNLNYDPADRGDSINVVVGVDVFQGLLPSDPPSSASSIAAYQRLNVGYRSGWARWCATCHDQAAANTPASQPAHFSGHPIEISIGSIGTDPHVDFTHWLAGTGEGFVGNSQVAGEGILRVPFLQPAASDFVTSQLVNSANKLSCISCHSSHGGNNAKALRWPYVEGGVNYLSGCQQCHHK